MPVDNMDFRKSIISAFELENMDEQKQTTYVLTIADQAIERVLPKALSNLEEEQVKEYTHLLENNPKPEDLLSFIRKNVSDFDGMVMDELTEMKKSSDMMKMAQ